MPHELITISCLSPGLKAIVRNEAKHITDLKERDTFLKLVSEMADCKNGGLMEFEHNGKRSKKGRKLSGYQIFVGQCLKGGNSSIKECAGEWKKKSDTEKVKWKT